MTDKPKTISNEQMVHLVRVYNSMQMALYFLNEFDRKMASNKKHPFAGLFKAQGDLAASVGGFIQSSQPITGGTDNAEA